MIAVLVVHRVLPLRPAPRPPGVHMLVINDHVLEEEHDQRRADEQGEDAFGRPHLFRQQTLERLREHHQHRNANEQARHRAEHERAGTQRGATIEQAAAQH